MFIYNRSAGIMLNMDTVKSISVDREKNAVKIETKDEHSLILKEYDSAQEAEKAISATASAMRNGKTQILEMPEKENVKRWLEIAEKYSKKELVQQ